MARAQDGAADDSREGPVTKHSAKQSAKDSGTDSAATGDPAGTAPGKADAAPGKADAAPGKADAAPGKADAAPGMGYEEARAALAEVVAELESGDTTLEEALALWERGEVYARICDAWLAGARERLSEEPEGPSD